MHTSLSEIILGETQLFCSNINGQNFENLRMFTLKIEEKNFVSITEKAFQCIHQDFCTFVMACIQVQTIFL